MADQSNPAKYVRDKIVGALWAATHRDEQREYKRAKADAKRPPVTFSDMMLAGGGWRQEFETWARNNNRGEVVNVLRDIEAYEGQQTVGRLVHIVDRYFDPTIATEYVTIDDDQITQALIQARNKPPNPLPPNLFDAAKASITSNNAPDSYRVFVGQWPG